MKLTLLTGLESYARGVKTYAYGDMMDIVKVSDFKLGFKYHHQQKTVNTLPELCEVFRGAGGESRPPIRIHGELRPDKALLGGTVERNKEFFKAPEKGVRLFNFDIDNWPCETFDYGDPQSGVAAIRRALCAKGLDWLTDIDMVVLWTQSAWRRDRLRCHLYMFLDNPVALPELRGWANAVNRLAGARVIDGSVWGEVQPDYIGRRITTPPLVDPLTEAQRVFFVKGVKESLSADKLHDEISKVTGSVITDNAPAVYKGACWQETIAKSGTPGLPEGEINAWGFRAAAQAVNEYGPDYVRRHINDLARDMHNRAWIGIRNNSERRGADDESTYGVARYTQYLRSACDRGYGGDIDKQLAIVEQALTEAAETGNIKTLLGKESLAAAREISKKRPAAWVWIQSEIKEKLRGKVSITEFRKLATGGEKTKDLTEAPAEDGSVKLIKKVLNLFDWVIDEDGNRYVGRSIRETPETPKGYELRTLGDNLENVFYHIGAQIEETVTPHFGKSCLAYLLGSLHGGAPAAERAKWVSRVVGLQQVQTEDGVLWWYLGPSESLRIAPDSGITRLGNGGAGINSPVLWYSPQGIKERSIADSCVPDDDIGRLWKYVLCREEDRPQVLGWLVSCLTSAKTQLIIELIGPSGSAKSSAGGALRDLVEPISSNPFHFKPKERKTLKGLNRPDKYRAVKRNAVIFLDNLSGLDAETQDFYCQIATGVCPDLRIMYTSVMEEVPLKRPMIMTGISPLITRPDLLSRSLRVHFSQAPEEMATALTEHELPVAWEQDRPVILRALAEICLKVLQGGGATRGRRGAYVGIMEAIYGQAAGRIQARADYRRSQMDIVVTNPFCLAFTAFVDEVLTKKQINCWKETPGSIHLKYKKWVESRWGQEVVVSLQCGERVTVLIDNQPTKGTKLLPKTVSGLGALLNKFTNELKSVCGLAVTEVSKTNGVRVRTIQKTVLM